MADQEGEIRRLRLSLEEWKIILLPFKDVLLWKKQWHPIAIIGGTTVLFTLLWLLEPSNLAILSLFGLFIIICDYIGPLLLSILLRCDKSYLNNDKEFEELCTNLVIYKTKFELYWLAYMQLRQTKPKLFYLATISLLCTLTYIGCVFNNSFLAYLTINGLLLSPGMEYNGILKRFHQFVYKVTNNLKGNVREQFNYDKKEN